MRHKAIALRFGALMATLLLVIAIPLMAQSVTAAKPGFTAVDLGTLGGTWSAAYDLNDKGEVVGVSLTVDGWNHAVLWKRGEIIDLNPLNSMQSVAWGINNRGDIVGWYVPNTYPYSGWWQACLWKASGQFIDLGQMWGSDGVSIAKDINDQGTIVGKAYTYYEAFIDPSSWVGHALVWSKGTNGYEMRDIGTLPGGDFAWATAINNNDQVVGVSGIWNSNIGMMEHHGFLWTELKGMIDLGSPSSGDYTQANGINNRGQMVGAVQLWPDGEYGYPGSFDHGFMWKVDGVKHKHLGIVPFKVPSGYVSMAPLAINDNGEVAGHLTLMDYWTTHACIWNKYTGVKDLGTLPGGTYSDAWEINARGWVAGLGDVLTWSGMEQHAILWKR